MRVNRLAALVMLAAVTPAAADPTAANRTDRCIAESELGQRLLLTRKFVAARPHLIACGNASCPDAVSRDCIKQLERAEASAASVVLSAELTPADDLASVRVFVDDETTGRSLTGEALWLDPGHHRFRFEHGGSAPITRELLVEEGARLVRVTATFGTSEPRVEDGGGPARTPHHHVLAGSLVVGGVVAAAAGTAFGLLARSRRADEQRDCASATSCVDYAAAQRDYTDAGHYATASTIAFVAGGVLVTAGVIVWFAATTTEKRGGVAVVPVLSPNQAGLTLQKAF
jgi:hypothetical protein